jgi:hypothetical protein
MARIDVEIEDYLDEVNTRYLVEELLKRRNLSEKDILELKQMKIGISEMAIPDFKTSEQLLNHIKIILGLRPWHDKKRIIQEIESL